MHSRELLRRLRKVGCTIEPRKGGHLLATRGERRTIVPMHGKQKEIGKGLLRKIIRDLDLDW